MSVLPLRDRRAERTAATRREILDAAWEQVRADGLASLVMRDLGARVGMRAQSLYGYFPSKHAIYDAMFAESNHELLRRLASLAGRNTPEREVREGARVFLEFCVEDPVRYQLLYQRTIPRFEPSPEAFAPAVEVLEGAMFALQACGVTDDSAVDAWTAVIQGLAAQQDANEPGGDRWTRLVDEITDMYLEHYVPKGKRKKP